ncbi:HEAT repeat domain-containing protein [Lignipirellula cremea]|uniref:HEAT repeat protein n=1 Tax=Lignipirellula cremea TaxID=2528010 RepID=A0A518DXX3_9BACT|nr:HEAT repeat domain-containing protein [Lignipirellula cremea]QDU96641.1 hypothetical protein Pla8534_44620 [Lignipirellula cremea]
MKDIEQLLQEFESDEADRCWIVVQLEEVPDERVVSLFVATLEDFDEDEEVRIEILKSLVMRKDAAESHARLGKAVLNVLRNDDEELIRQFAAQALWTYPEVEGVLDCLESTVRNETEDLDVRHNALGAIESNRAMASYREALQRLVNVPELGPIAQRTLDSD